MHINERQPEEKDKIKDAQRRPDSIKPAGGFIRIDPFSFPALIDRCEVITEIICYYFIGVLHTHSISSRCRKISVYFATAAFLVESAAGAAVVFSSYKVPCGSLGLAGLVPPSDFT